MNTSPSRYGAFVSTPVSRRGFAALGAAVIGIGAVACGGGTRPGGGSGGAGGGASAWVLTGGPEDMFRASFEQWNSDNTDRQIATEYFANDSFKEKIRTAIGSGTQPTLVYNWAGGTLADYVDSEKVLDLTGLVPEVESRAIPSVLEAGKVDGTLYAVPNNNAQPVVLYLNKKLMDEHGVAAPETWDDLMAAVETFKAAGVIPIALAGASQWPYLMWIQYLTDRIGGPEVFQAVMAGEADAWSHPAITEALTRIQELVEAGAFGDGYSSVVADAAADVALVHTDRAAMMLHGSWVYSDFLNNAKEWTDEGNLDYGTFPSLPDGAGDPANIVGNPANFWSVSADASEEERDIVIEFLETFNLNEDASRSMIESGLVPAATGIEDLIAESERADYLSFVYQMVMDAPHFQQSWDQALRAEPAQELLTNLSGVFLMQQTPEEFVTAMNGTL